MLNLCIKNSYFHNLFFNQLSMSKLLAGFFLLLSLMMFPHAGQASTPIRVAFVLVGPADSVGWSHSHDLGRQHLEQVMKGSVETTVVEFVAEGRSARTAIQELATKNDIVFATSSGYMVSTEGVAKNNSQVKFENVSGTRFGSNLAGFATRTYQPRYLAGLIAGKTTQSGKIGYIASHPIPEVIRSINAFTIGVRKTNPTAVVEVQWTGSWHKPEKEKQVAAKLIANGADVLTHHTDSSTVAELAEENNVKVIGFHSDMSPFAPTQHLVSVTHNWGPYYVKRVQALMDNKWQGQSQWMGMKDKTSQLSALNESIPKDVRDLVAQQQAAIISGELKVFAGPIKNSRGRVRVKEGDVLSDEKLLRSSWYVEGVTGSLLSY